MCVCGFDGLFFARIRITCPKRPYSVARDFANKKEGQDVGCSLIYWLHNDSGDPLTFHVTPAKG